MPFLTGHKIELRAIEPEDVDLLMQWENNIVNWEVSGTITPFSRNLLQQYIDNAHLDIYQVGQLRLMIQEGEGQTIGTIDIFDFDAFHHRAGVGILIGDQAKRGNGYASESLRLVKKYCFEHLGLKQIYCNILVDNTLSLNLFQKAGFEITGTRHQWVRSGGQYKDQHFLQLFREE